ncbi:exosortase/archaeosortase family protein [Opitutus terrae]|nr:exosortase/archaeosortase family protein [Opitutus terrae]
MPASTSRRRWLAAGACALAGLALFQFFGNATHGYVDTSSTFWWWISQWIDPGAESEHGWVILGISGWLLWRNLRRAARGEWALRSQSEVESARTKDADDSGSGNVEPRRPRRGCGDEGVAAPAAAMVAGLGLHALGFVAQQTRISIVAVLLFTWGVLRLGGGRRWGRAALFPLAFMLFAIPVNVLDSLGFWLRMWVVDAAGAIAHLGGVDVVRSGTQLFSPDGSYQYDVAAACSGVRSLVALAALSLLIGYLNFRSWWRRALVFALCFPLTYLGNLTRVLVIIVAAELGGQAWGERAHEVMGFGVFVIVLGGVAAAAKLLQRVPEIGERRAESEERRASHNRQDQEARGRDRSPSGPRSVNDETQGRGRLGEASLPRAEQSRAVTGAATSSGATFLWRGAESAPYLAAFAIIGLTVGEVVFLAQLSVGTPRGEAGVRLSADGRDPIELPAFIGTEWIGRRAEVTAVERAVLPADTGFSRRNYVHVQGGAHVVLFSIVLSGRDRTSIHRPELCLVGQGWTIRDQRAIELRWRAQPPANLPATLLRTELVEARTGRRVPTLTVYWFVDRDAVVASHWGRFWHDAWNRVRHGRADRWAYVLLQTDAADGEEPALARLQVVLQGVWPSVTARHGTEQ